jgi:hypothetical protein
VRVAQGTVKVVLMNQTDQPIVVKLSAAPGAAKITVIAHSIVTLSF